MGAALVALCRLLLSRPDLLLLDEPTNHLDAESVQWLEQYLAAYPGTVLAVTHDRYFLDNVAGWILELDRGPHLPVRGQLQDLPGDQGGRLAAEARASAGRKRVLAWELEWVRVGTKGRHDKGRARLRRYEELAAEAERDRPVDFDEIQVLPGPRLGDVVVEADGADQGLRRPAADRRPVVQPSRAASSGSSGPTGPARPPCSSWSPRPRRRTGASCGWARRCGWPTSTRTGPAWTPPRPCSRPSPAGSTTSGSGREMPTRAYVATFGFKGTDQQKPVGVLSGGERNRPTWP